VWGFLQQPSEVGQPMPPVGVPTWLVMVFPCEHLVWLPDTTDAAGPDSRVLSDANQVGNVVGVDPRALTVSVLDPR
jgi:hypothetical protein